MNKYKRAYNFKSTEGAEGGKLLKWLIIGVAVLIAALAFFTK